MQAKQQMFERDFTTATSYFFLYTFMGSIICDLNARFQHEMLTFPEIRKPGQCVTPFASHQFVCLDEIILRIRAFGSKYTPIIVVSLQKKPQFWELEKSCASDWRKSAV